MLQYIAITINCLETLSQYLNLNLEQYSFYSYLLDQIAVSKSNAADIVTMHWGHSAVYKTCSSQYLELKVIPASYMKMIATRRLAKAPPPPSSSSSSSSSSLHCRQVSKICNHQMVPKVSRTGLGIMKTIPCSNMLIGP